MKTKMKKALSIVSTLVLALLALQAIGGGAGSAAADSGALVDSGLEAALAAQPVGTSLPAVITYDRRPGTAELGRLQSLGVTKGFALRELPMVITDLNAVQLAAVRTQPGVISVWGNEVMENFTNESLRFIGVPQLMADGEVTKKRWSRSCVRRRTPCRTKSA